MLHETLDGPLDLLALHRHAPSRYPFLLQSAGGLGGQARYDILFSQPGAWLAQRGGQQVAQGVAPRGDFFESLDHWARAERGPSLDAVPFAGGWFLYLGYEAARQVEPRLNLPPTPHGLPDLLAVRCTAAAIHDHAQGRTHLVAESEPAALAELRADLAAAAAVPASPGRVIDALDEDPPQRFTDGVARILDYLRAGDAFQVNLSRAWRGRLAPGVDATDVYARLRVANPAPYAGLLRWGTSAIISSSPERLVRVDGRHVETRPIAGTRPRDPDPARDHALREQLLASRKERAEHTMLIDLERNDLGRVCEPGSVRVAELMALESYAHVHHIVSGVEGRLRPGTGPGALLRAIFPGGTITGCPKVRAMEIIAELEGEGRGPYTGAMGYLGRDGRMDLNILIRTLVVDGSALRLRTGAGIVADSRPEAELAETRAKARGLLRALGLEA